jgi:hypothetical protein
MAESLRGSLAVESPRGCGHLLGGGVERMRTETTGSLMRRSSTASSAQHRAEERDNIARGAAEKEAGTWPHH